jgi:hypothetical protein
MSNSSKFNKSAEGFEAKRKGADEKNKKVTVAQMRHDCLALAYDELYIGDFLPYPPSYLRWYVDECKYLETSNSLEESLKQTIKKMAYNNLEERQSVVDIITQKSLDRLAVMKKAT